MDTPAKQEMRILIIHPWLSTDRVLVGGNTSLQLTKVYLQGLCGSENKLHLRLRENCFSAAVTSHATRTQIERERERVQTSSTNDCFLDQCLIPPPFECLMTTKCTYFDFVLLRRWVEFECFLGNAFFWWTCVQYTGKERFIFLLHWCLTFFRNWSYMYIHVRSSSTVKQPLPAS